jgi:type II secretory pathway pseudopilin PulG
MTRVAQAAGRDGERGASLVSLIGAMTIMFVLMSAAVPSWRYVMKDAREEELIFRGEQIARAIKRYQDKHGSSLPPSLEILVQQRFLRKAYKEPFAKDGKWRLLRPGDALLPPGVGGIPGMSRPGSTTPPSTMVGQAPTAGGTIGGTIGGAGIVGVASFSKDKSLRIFNGRTRYNEWMFIAGQPNVLGRQFGVPLNPGGGVAPLGSTTRPSPGSGRQPSKEN